MNKWAYLSKNNLLYFNEKGQVFTINSKGRHILISRRRIATCYYKNQENLSYLFNKKNYRIVKKWKSELDKKINI